jgi:cell filamentation protein
MVIENKLGIENQAELNRAEEQLAKTRAKELIDTGKLEAIDIGTYKGLSEIHAYLFQDVYDFAGKLRTVNIAKGNFQFAPRMFLEQSLNYIDKLPHNTFDEIIDKYSDMNVAHPFRDGNGRSMRLWLDCILMRNLGKIVDWNSIEKDEYLSAMKRSAISAGELKYLIMNALTNDLSKESFYKGIDTSFYYEGYSKFKIRDL